MAKSQSRTLVSSSTPEDGYSFMITTLAKSICSSAWKRRISNLTNLIVQ